MRIINIAMCAAALGLSVIGCGNDNRTSEGGGDGSNNKEFIWDFSEARKYSYSYSQSVNVESQLSREGALSKTTITGSGKLNVLVKPNDVAEITLKDIETKMSTYNEDGSTGKTSSRVLPATVVQGMKPNGRFDQPNVNPLFDLLFPLPSYDFKEGESDKIPMKIPYNANGSSLFIEGFNTLTFEGYETIEGRKCAVMKGVIDVSKLDIPDEIEGNYEGSTTGNATYYFDLEDHCYVGADIHMVMDVFADRETKGEDDFGMYMKMKSDNVFKIRLQRILNGVDNR